MNHLSKTLMGGLLASVAVGAIAPPSLASFFHNGWHYAIDVGHDSIAGDLNNPGTVNYGGTIYEMYGLAIKENTATNEVWVGFNANLPLAGRTVPTVLNGFPVPDGNIGWGDMFFDFTGAGDMQSAFGTGQMYSVKFAQNDSGAIQAGLYQSVNGASVSSINAGYGNFTIHNNAITGPGGLTDAWAGDLRHNDSYFTNGAGDQISNVIAAGSGTRVADVSIRSQAELENEGFDLGQFFETGANIFGFSFQKQPDMVGNFVATIIEECVNDAMSLLGYMTPEHPDNLDPPPANTYTPTGTISQEDDCPITYGQLEALAPDVVDGNFKIFYDTQSHQWYDPPVYEGYTFEGKDGTVFTQIKDFPCGISANKKYTIEIGGKKLGTFAAGETFDFTTLPFDVNKFTILFPKKDGEEDQTPFALQLAFGEDVGSFSMEKFEFEKVPEPQETVLLSIGILGGLSWLKKRTKTRKKFK
ncbi:MAG: XDD3 family exosortase-dependent surface protein [Cyanobacteria bacterium P01_G01_bin.54]